MNNFKEIFKKHNQDVLKFVEEYLSSKDGQDFIKKITIKEIKIILEDNSLEDIFMSNKTRDKFYLAIEDAIMKRLNIK